MQLGNYTFDWPPSAMTIIKPDKYCSDVLTFDSVGFFSWGMAIVGKKLTLRWNYMSVDQYESLHTLYAADAPVVFDPDDESGNTYTVEIINLQGEYYIHPEINASGIFRKNIELELLILSEEEGS
jgi:hypothetical protein